MENLITTYKLPKDSFSEVFYIIILYLQSFQNLKWRKASELLFPTEVNTARNGFSNAWNGKEPYNSLQNIAFEQLFLLFPMEALPEMDTQMLGTGFIQIL